MNDILSNLYRFCAMTLIRLKAFSATRKKTIYASTALLCAIFIMGILPGSESLTLLGRKSTARQVYSYLEQNNQLAPYVSSGGTAVITGGNSGIGVETVKTLVESGMNVVLCARNIESATYVKESLPQNQQKRVEIQKMDLSSLTSVQEAADAIRSKHQKIDCLINNAGISKSTFSELFE